MAKKLAAAVALGRRGGRVVSPQKSAAARVNGLLGGRPRTAPDRAPRRLTPASRRHPDHVPGFCDFACLPLDVFFEFCRAAPVPPDERRAYVVNWMVCCRQGTVVDLDGLEPHRYWLSLWSAHHPPRRP